MDSTPDIVHKEQLSICVRIVASDGSVTEHLLGCKNTVSTTAKSLFEIILKAFESKDVAFQKLVAQTYDGASNMSGCYNGLQAIIKERIGKHILYVHCYAHSLNLGLKDSVGVDINVTILFDSLEPLHHLFNRCHKIHGYFEKVQENVNAEVMTIKRLNTVRWILRELCLKVFHQRYDIIMNVLEEVSEDMSLDEKHRIIANGLLQKFSRKEIVATACLFNEIFGITGPLSRYLQSTRIDLGKACNLVSGALSQLETLRTKCNNLIEKVNLLKNCLWDSEGPRARRIRWVVVDEGDEDVWRRKTFLPVLDQIISGRLNNITVIVSHCDTIQG